MAALRQSEPSRRVYRAIGLIAAALLCLGAGCGDESAPAQPGEAPPRFEEVIIGEPYQGVGEGHSPGLIFSDLNRDGEPDLLLLGSLHEPALGAPPGNAPRTPDRLYLNNGAGGFELVEQPFPDARPDWPTGAVAADFDNDGDADIFVIAYRESNRLYENRDGDYVDVTDSTDPTPDDGAGDRDEGLGGALDVDGAPLDWSLAAAWGDVDRDGFSDLFVGNHRCCGQGGLDESSGGVRDALYRNNGDGAFSDITLSTGIARDVAGSDQTSTMAAGFIDIDLDGWIDLYISQKNYGPSRDQLHLNDGDSDGDGVWDGTFTEYFASQDDPDLGDTTPFAMSVSFGDYDNDGDFDVYLTDEGTMDLYRNLLSESGSFGLEAVTPSPAPAPDFDWGADWIDADNDGDLDLHVATGVSIAGELIQDYFYENLGGGELRDISNDAGTAQSADSRGTAHADYDGDGWVDIYVVNRDVPSRLLRNVTGRESANHWLHLDLRGAPELSGTWRSTRDALGARVTVAADLDGNGEIEAGERQIRHVASGSNLAATTSSLRVELGLGVADRADVVVNWPSGRITAIEDVAADQVITVVETD